MHECGGGGGGGEGSMARRCGQQSPCRYVSAAAAPI